MRLPWQNCQALDMADAMVYFLVINDVPRRPSWHCRNGSLPRLSQYHE
jgi:hypothetical protein